MALKNPSDFFDEEKKESIIDKLVERPELKSFSDAFNVYKENISKFDDLSETLKNIENIQSDIKDFIKKEDLDNAVISYAFLLEETVSKLKDDVKGINEKHLIKIRSNVSGLAEKINNFVEIEAPKYKKSIVESEIKSSNRYEKFKNDTDIVLENISKYVNDKYGSIEGINKDAISEITKSISKHKIDIEEKTEKNISSLNETLDKVVGDLEQKINLVSENKDEIFEDLSKKIVEVKKLKRSVNKDLKLYEDHKNIVENKISDLEVEIVRSKSNLKEQNKEFVKVQKNVKTNFNSIREEFKTVVDKLNLDNLEEKNNELSKKVRYLEEVFAKFNEKEFLSEGLLNIPPETDNSDPLTPLDREFVTLDQLQNHYRLFLNRIQQQLATFGGGGETQLKYLDDVVGIATNPAAYDGGYLRYVHSLKKFAFSSPSDGDTWIQGVDGPYTMGRVGIGTSLIQSGAYPDNALVVEGNARITGILTIGTASITLNADTGSISSGDVEVVSPGGGANFVGILTAGGANFTGDVSIGGTLTYEDVKNIDSIGIITAREDVRVGRNFNVTGVSTVNNLIISGIASYTSSSHTKLPSGTTAQRPASAVVGDIRYNTTTNQFEGYKGSSPSWGALGGGGGSPGGSNTQIQFNDSGSFEGDANLTFNGSKLAVGVDLDVDGHTELDDVNVSGVATIGNVTVGGATTDLIVEGNARVTGILSVGTGTVVIDETTVKTGTSNLHSVGIEIAGINVLGADTPIGTGATIYDEGGAGFTGVVTATSFDGNLATTNLTGTITNAQLAGSIANDKLANNSVSYGGIELALGASDATPAFDLQHATNYPYTSLTGITTTILGDATPKLGGNLDGNSKSIYGVGVLTATQIADSNGSVGSASSVLSSTGSGLSWVAQSGGGGISNIGIQSAGTLVGTATTINFTAGNITVANDIANVSVGSSFAYAGARVYFSTGTPDGTGAYYYVSSGEISTINLDTHSFYNSSNGRYEIPAGVTKVRLRANVWGDSGSGSVANAWQAYKNGSAIALGDGGFFFEVESGSGYTNVGSSGVSGAISVSEGDYIQLGYNVNSTARSWAGTWQLEVLEGSLLGHYFASTNVTNSDNITVQANNTADETVYPIFVDGATGIQGPESDTGFTYNPSSGNLTATQLTGTLQTASQTNITALGTIATGTWNGTAIGDSYISSAATWNAKQAALTFGIANTNALKIDDADAADNDYAKLTASGIEGRSYSEVKTDLSLDNVENTALSTWAGTSNITTVGTLGSLNVTGDVSIGGTLTYEDVTNIDSVGLITARSGIEVTSGGINVASGVVTATTFDAPSYHMDSTPTRDKYRLWGNASWAMGMDSGMTFGGLDSYAITSQVTNHDDRGWVFLDASHTDAQGAMSLNTIGELVVAKSIRAGGGESDTSAPRQPLDIIGDGIIIGDVGIGTINPTGTAALTNNEKVLAVGVVTANTLYTDILKVGTAITATAGIVTANTIHLKGGDFGPIYGGSATKTDAAIIVDENFHIYNVEASGGWFVNLIEKNNNVITIGQQNTVNVSEIKLIPGKSGTTQLMAGDGTSTPVGILTANESGVTVSGILTATSFSGSGASLNTLNASELDSGTIPDARFPATLPTASGANLTSLPGGELTGIVTAARLASNGTANSSTFLRGDGSWATPSGGGGSWSSDSQENLYAGTNAGANSDADTCFNIALGYCAGCSLNEGDDNIILGGRFTGRYLTSGSRNVFIGCQAGMYSITNTDNVFLGSRAGFQMCNGDSNVAIGECALKGSTTTSSNSGACNIAIGNQAGLSVTSANDSIFMGRCAGMYRSTGAYNIAFGKEALLGSSTVGSNTGSYNIAFGFESGQSITSGGENITIGYYAGKTISTCSGNIMLGTRAGENTNGSHNFFGLYSAGRCNTSGKYNIFFGVAAGKCITTANSSIGIGQDAGMCNAGDHLIAIGDYAAKENEGVENIAIGTCAGKEMTSGTYNIFLGHCASGTGVITGSYNISFGVQAGKCITSGGKNIAIGKWSMRDGTTTGSYNNMFGDQSGYNITSGGRNTGLGNGALYGLTEGLCNVAVGSQAGYKVTTGDNNITLGFTAGCLIAGGDENVIIGKNSGKNTADANKNVFLGSQAGETNISGCCNVAIGYDVDLPSATGNTQFAIGVGANRWITGDNNFDVGIGHTNPIFKFDVVNGTANTGANVNNPGDLSVTGANKTLTGGGANVFINSNTAHAIDTGGSLGFSGRNTDSSTNSVLWGTIKGAKENGTTTNTAGYLAFAVSNHSAGALQEKLRIGSSGQLGIGGANYGTDGQVLTSTGPNSAPAWEDAAGGGGGGSSGPDPVIMGMIF